MPIVRSNRCYHWLITVALLALPACVGTSPLGSVVTDNEGLVARPTFNTDPKRLPVMTLKDHVLLQSSLVTQTGGALTANNASRLITDNACGFQDRNAIGSALLQASDVAQPFEEQPLAGMPIVLQEKYLRPSSLLIRMHPDAIASQEGPVGLTHTVVASRLTAKGKIQVSVLAASETDTTVSDARTLALTQLKQTAQGLWGRLNESAYQQLVVDVARALTPDDAR